MIETEYARGEGPELLSLLVRVGEPPYGSAVMRELLRHRCHLPTLVLLDSRHGALVHEVAQLAQAGRVCHLVTAVLMIGVIGAVLTVTSLGRLQ